MVGFNEMIGVQAEGAGFNRRLTVHRKLGHRLFKRFYYGAPTAWRIMVVKQNFMSMRAKVRCIRARCRSSPRRAIRCVYASMRSSASMLVVLAAVVCSGLVHAQMATVPTPLSNEEALSFIKGKNLNSVHLAGGEPYLQFKDDGTMYGNNSGSSDSGKWRVEDGKLCMTWRQWEYEGCGKLVRVGDEVQHLYPDGASVHLIFKK